METGKKLGREEGYAAGREEGYRDGLKEAQSAAQLLREAAQQWAGIEAQVADFFERAVLQLTLAVSRQVIRRDLAKETADDLRARLQGLVDELRLDNLLVTFALHPDQVTLLRQHLHALPDSWNLHPDARMELGGVRVRVQWPEGFDGVVAAQEWDARIETRWSEVVSRILEGGG
ncbi:FliH/SctL family protein [Acidithiobacillus caldus]